MGDNMKLRYLIPGSVIIAFSLAAIPSLDVPPSKVRRTQAVSEADKLRFELCPVGYVSSDEDLREFCSGVK